MKRICRRCKRIIRFYYLKIIRIQMPPQKVAIGVAIGVFVGCLPIIPFHTPTALGLAIIMRGSKLAAVLCTFFVNPLTIIPFYAGIYHIGRLALPEVHATAFSAGFSLSDMLSNGLEQGLNLLVIMSVGGLILGVPASIIAYIFSHRVLKQYYIKKQQGKHSASLTASKPKILPTEKQNETKN